MIGVCVPLSPSSADVASGVEWYDSGIGFAVPLDGLDKTLERLKAGETLKWGFLGVQVEPAGKPDQGKYESGVIVKEVVADSPAQQSGLQVGDKLISIGGETIADHTHLVSLVGRYLAGEKVEVVLMRGEEQKAAELTLAEAPPPMPMPPPLPRAEGQPKGSDKPPSPP